MGDTKECSLINELPVHSTDEEISLKEEVLNDIITLEKQLELKKCNTLDLEIEQILTDTSEVNLEVKNVSVNSSYVKKEDDLEIIKVSEENKILLPINEENLCDAEQTINDSTNIPILDGGENGNYNESLEHKNTKINVNGCLEINKESSKLNLLEEEPATICRNICDTEQTNDDSKNVLKSDIDRSRNFSKSVEYENIQMDSKDCLELNKDHNVELLKEAGIIKNDYLICVKQIYESDIDKNSLNFKENSSRNSLEARNITCDIEKTNRDFKNILKLDINESINLDKSFEHEDIQMNLEDCPKINQSSCNVILLEKEALSFKDDHLFSAKEIHDNTTNEDNLNFNKEFNEGSFETIKMDKWVSVDCNCAQDSIEIEVCLENSKKEKNLEACENEDDSKLSSTISKCSLDNQSLESKLITDETNITYKEVFKTIPVSNEFTNTHDKNSQVNKTCNNGDMNSLQKNKINYSEVNKNLGSKNIYRSAIGTESMDKGVFCESVDKPKLINKFQHMNWLKNNSVSDASMNQNARSVLKFDKNDECTDDTSSITRRNYRKSRLMISQNRVQNERSNISTLDSKLHNAHQQNNVPSTAWTNKNTAKQLFPKVHSVIVDQAREREEYDLAIIQSICTAQQENEVRKMAENQNLKPIVENSMDDDDDNSWSKVRRNLPDDLDKELKNESSARIFVDKFGRVDGLTEKCLFMGKGARRKEQEFLKSFSENKIQLQNNISSSGFQTQSFPRKPIQDSNISSQEIKKGSNLTRNQSQGNKESCSDISTEVQTVNKGQERPIHGRVDKRVSFANQKDASLTQTKNNSDKSASDKQENLFDKYRSNSYKSQGDYNKSQNYYDRYQDTINTSKNQEPFYKNSYSDDCSKNYHKSYNKKYTAEKNQDSRVENKEHMNRGQNYSSKSYDYTGQNQDHSNRNQETSRSQEYFVSKVHNDEDWDNDECSPNFNSKRNSNKNQILSNQRDKQQESKDKYSHDFVNQTNVKIDESKKGDLENKSDSLKRNSNKILISSGNIDYNSHISTIQRVDNVPILKEVNNDSKQDIVDAETNVSYGNISENSASEPKPNVVMSFVGNQNVQRALGLNPNTFNQLQVANSQINKTDVSLPNTTNSSVVNSFINSNMIQQIPFLQSAPCANFNTALTCSNSMPNMNPTLCNALNYSVNHGMGNQYSSDAEFGFNHSPTADISIEQLRMNEISNDSQVLLKLHNKVDSLSKELASAQALLLAAQMKTITNLSSLNNAPIANPSLPNQQLPLDFLPINYSTASGFTSSNIQQVQTEVLQPSTPVNQLFNFQAFQQGNAYQQPSTGFQQYQNINLANVIPRGRSVSQSNERREIRGNGPQFYHQ